MNIKLIRGEQYTVYYCNFDEQEMYHGDCEFLGCTKDVWGRWRWFLWDSKKLFYYSTYLNPKFTFESEEVGIVFEVDKRSNKLSELGLTNKGAGLIATPKSRPFS